MTRAKVIWQKATSLGYCRILQSCHVLSCHGRHLGFDRTGNSACAFDPPTRKPYTIERNMKWIG